MYVRPALFTCVLSIGGCSLPTEEGAAPISAGDAGPRGADGEPGNAGENGRDGKAGATGAPGEAGARGETGARGPTGERGPIGATGERGIRGPTGDQGPQGAPGPIGPTGPTGPQGSPGIPGAAGTPGTPAAMDGTRLKVVHITSTDGMRAPLGGYWDAHLQTSCTPTMVNSLKFYCLPLGGLRLFADPDCLEQVAVPTSPWGLPHSPYVRLNETIEGVTVSRNFELGPHTGTQQAYTGSPENCSAYPLAALLSSGYYQPPRYLQAEVPDSAFAEVAYEY